MDELGDPLEALLQGKVKTVEYSNGQLIVDAPRRGRVYMAGSFNPLHKGHRGMLAAALQTQQERKPGRINLYGLLCWCWKGSGMM